MNQNVYKSVIITDHKRYRDDICNLEFDYELHLVDNTIITCQIFSIYSWDEINLAMALGYKDMSYNWKYSFQDHLEEMGYVQLRYKRTPDGIDGLDNMLEEMYFDEIFRKSDY